MEKSGTLKSLVAPFPHLKTALSPGESGSAEGVVTEGGKFGESHEEIKCARGALFGTCSCALMNEERAGSAFRTTRLWTPELERLCEEK